MKTYTLVSCIDSRVENLTKFYGRFEIGPFAPGQALTVANALRRALLSQLSGTSITLLEIQGASNEYEVLNGVRESVLDIILNLKQVVLTSDFEILSPQVGFLSVKGPGIVRASDLKLPAWIYAVDPNQYIATLSNTGRLNMKFLICSGKNYITYTPSDYQYSEWLVLLKKAKPFNNLTFQNGNHKYDDKKQTKKQESSGEFINTFGTKIEKSNAFDPLMSSGNSVTEGFSITEKQAPLAEKPSDFYNQWLKDRYSLTPPCSNLDHKTTYAKGELSENFQVFSNSSQKKNKKPLRQNLNSIDSQKTLSLDDQRKGFEKVSLTSSDLSLSEVTNKRGYFPIDAVFMPVNRVNYLIESNEDFKLPRERLVLEVWTNGSIHPRHAIHKAAKSLIQLFLPLQQIRTCLHTGTKDFLEGKKTGAISNKVRTSQILLKNQNVRLPSTNSALSKLDSRILKLDIGNLELTARPYSCLKMANINTIEDLIAYSKKDLLLIKNFGQRSLFEVEKALQKMKLTLN
uniref:DNA-directed RNA polymerase subunit alpha n=1 Tax=Sarcinofilum mucosum TaxID=141643 RepID=A0A1W6EGB3_SARMC|nr:alpha subunit of RNA polymerase [Sarcinofilum mucosum]ARK14427.1 alpha subunit of RNA polymerase [Sarcinofilum mucosum]